MGGGSDSYVFPTDCLFVGGIAPWSLESFVLDEQQSEQMGNKILFTSSLSFKIGQHCGHMVFLQIKQLSPK